MSPRSLRLLETALVSAFVSFGVSAVVLLGMAPPSTAPISVVEVEDDLLEPFLQLAIEADVALASADEIDDLAAYRAQSLYAWYVEQSEARAQLTDLEWARSRAETLEQLRADIEAMRQLEAEAKALEASKR